MISSYLVSHSSADGGLMFHFLQNVFRWIWTGIFVPLVDQAHGNLSSVIGPRQTFVVSVFSPVAWGGWGGCLYFCRVSFEKHFRWIWVGM